ncbi:TPA: aspartyl-phosphate phosphatase Spo0E family protein [Bacillus cereus]
MQIGEKHTTLVNEIEKKRQEMMHLTKRYMLTSPEVIRASEELDRLMNRLENTYERIKYELV